MIIGYEYDEYLECEVPKVQPPYEMFGEWLFSEIQGGENADETIQACNMVLAGRVNKVELDGNAYLAVVEPGGISLVNMYTDKASSEKLDLRQAVDLVANWKSHMATAGKRHR